MFIKKIFSLILAIMVMFGTFTVSASTIGGANDSLARPGINGSLYFPENQAYPENYSPADILRTQEKLAKTELLAEETYLTRATDYISIPGTFTMFQQQNDWYCVPASVRSVLYYINGSAPSQGSIANAIGTHDYIGTNVMNTTSYLNQQQTENWYVSRSSVTQSTMYSSLRVAIVSSQVPALIGATSPRSNGFLPYETDGHCVVANAIKNDNTYVQCGDPLGGKNNGNGGTYAYYITCPISRAPSYVNALVY